MHGIYNAILHIHWQSVCMQSGGSDSTKARQHKKQAHWGVANQVWRQTRKDKALFVGQWKVRTELKISISKRHSLTAVAPLHTHASLALSRATFSEPCNMLSLSCCKKMLSYCKVNLQKASSMFMFYDFIIRLNRRATNIMQYDAPPLSHILHMIRNKSHCLTYDVFCSFPCKLRCWLKTRQDAAETGFIIGIQHAHG